ncbi:MAG: HD domain-containing protein [Helicobacteraceae bacterium]|jgi:hypothetical protein|nr:HD domain-containing protein [Helicobacteraceae bacterium]
MTLPNTPCCKYVKAFVKWVWRFLFSGRRLLLNFIILPALTAYVICLLWGYYVANVWVFNPIYYADLPQKEKLMVICVGAFMLFVVAYALVMQHARSARLDCSIRNAHIAKLAKLWLNEEQLQARVEAANEAWKQERLAQIEKEVADRTLVVSTEIVGRYIKERLAPYLSKFSKVEIEILRFLFNLLEKKGGVPSVASKFKNDYDIKQFEKCNGSKPIPVTSDGKTSYEILAKYSLRSHSISVASIIIDEVISRTDSYSTSMPRAVIAALAHDIGKIEKSDIASINDEVAKVTDHPYLSGMIIKERFPEYVNIDELVLIVQEHHLPIDKGASICAAALKAADQKARREEIKEWFVKTYGKEAKSPDPYMSLGVADNKSGGSGQDDGDSDRGKQTNQNAQSNKNADDGDRATSNNQTNQPEYATNAPKPIMTAEYQGGSLQPNIEYYSGLEDREGGDPASDFGDSSRQNRDTDYDDYADSYTGEGETQTNYGDRANTEWLHPDLDDYGDRRGDLDGDYQASADRAAHSLTATSKTPNKTKSNGANAKSKSAKTSKSKFGETKTPKYPQSDDYRRLEFDLPSCETTILDRLRTEPIVIERSGANMFVPVLNIVSVPYENCLLVSFARLAGLIGGLFEGDRDGDRDFGAMTRYAVDEWRKRDIVLLVGEGYSTRKFEYLYDGEQRKVINLIPFSLDALMLSADDLIDRAKQHPLYSLISDFKMTKR